MVSDVLSRNNPWKVEAQYLRTKSPPCRGRRWIAAEEERKAMDNVAGRETEVTTPGKANREKKEITLPICTRENVNYTLECITCKKEGIKRIYFGKNS